VKSGKACPIQPCPTKIPWAWLMCEFHWRQEVPPQIRALNKRARAQNNHALGVYSAVLALSFVWSTLEQVGVTMPPEHNGYPWNCRCPSCSTILRRAQKDQGIHDPDQWPYIVERAGMFAERVVARAGLVPA
jgi:hypothetical protein